MERPVRKLKKSVILLLVPVFIIILTYVCIIDKLPAAKKITIIDPNIKYILQWTSPDTEPFIFMGNGQYVFMKEHCHVNNCYVTPDRTLLNKLSDYDAIVFHGPELHRDSNYNLPNVRSTDQKYVFASMESSHYYPIKQAKYEGFFNWTWTYKLDSDLYYGYIVIRNEQGEIIGPRSDMHWLKENEMKPISDEFKKELSTKTKSAVWFVSNCNTPSKREVFVKNMTAELRKYNMTVDIFGGCGSNTCPRTDKSHCSDLVKRSYYFYLSFENSFSEDYVTEKLLTALDNNAVPIVYGGANYTRFMPDGAYLNARKLGVSGLVKKMVEAINDPDKYYNYFKWRNHYSYHNPELNAETNYYCRLCSMLNENVTNKNYEHFSKWWNPP